MNFIFLHIFFDKINRGYTPAILKKSSLWLFPFYMNVSTYYCYKKVCRTMHTAVVLYLHNEVLIVLFWKFKNIFSKILFKLLRAQL